MEWLQMGNLITLCGVGRMGKDDSSSNFCRSSSIVEFLLILARTFVVVKIMYTQE